MIYHYSVDLLVMAGEGPREVPCFRGGFGFLFSALNFYISLKWIISVSADPMFVESNPCYLDLV